MDERAPALPVMKFIGGALSGLVMSAAALAALSLNAPMVHVAGGREPAEAPEPPHGQVGLEGASGTVPSGAASRDSEPGPASDRAPPVVERVAPRHETAPPAQVAAPGPQTPAQPGGDGRASATFDSLTADEPAGEVEAPLDPAEPEAVAVGDVAPAPSQGPRIAEDAEVAAAAPRSVVQDQPAEPAADASPPGSSESATGSEPLAQTVSTEAPSASAWRANAVPSAPHAGAPLLAIVMRSNGLSTSEMSRLSALGAPVTFAVPVVDSEGARGLRAAGFEILASIPSGAPGDWTSLIETLSVVGVELQIAADAEIRETAREQGLLLLSPAVGDGGEDPYAFAPTIEAAPDSRAALLLEGLREAERRAARDGEAVVVIPSGDAAFTALARWAALPRLAAPAPLSALAARRVDD